MGSYLVHTLAGLAVGAVSLRGFSVYERLPGRAITTGQAQRIDDLALTGDGVHDLEGVLISAGLRATLAVPIRRGLDSLGALLFASRPPVTYGDDDVQVAALLAAGLSAAFETSQAYQTLADERMTMLGVLGSTSDAVIAMNLSGLVLLANGAVRQMLGLTPDVIEGRPLLEAVDYAPLRELFVKAKPGISELPLPDGRIARRAWFRSSRRSVSPWGWRSCSGTSRS